MTEPRYHVQEPSSADLTLWTGLCVICFFMAIGIGIYAGVWRVMVEWLAYNWTTIWQILVLMFLVAIVGKR